MTTSYIYKLKAEVFFLMTGYQAPGKASAKAAGPPPIGRDQTWKDFNKKYEEVIYTVIEALDNRRLEVTDDIIDRIVARYDKVHAITMPDFMYLVNLARHP